MKKYIVLIAISVLLAGCAKPQNKAEEGTHKGLAIGAATGAILGQVIGGNTKATLLGASIGALAGGVIGNKYGKQADEQEEELRRQLATLEQANVQRNADILSVTFMSDLLFDSDSAALKPGAKEQIKHVSSVLTKYTDTTVRIDGHTDNTGSFQYNQHLSELRAKNVMLTFVEHGVMPSRINTIGFGATAPIADNSTEAGRRLNRRVVITINPPQQS